MQLTTVVILATALGAVAHPSGHAHHHHHDKRAISFYKAGGKKGPKAATTPAAASTTAAASTSVAASPAAVAVNVNANAASFSTKFCGASKRATVAQDTYVGNTGATWGCNIIMVSDANASKFTYVTRYVNKGSSSHHVVCFNKSGPDGQPLSGSFGNKAVEFDLAPGQGQSVAFDSNSQGSCAFAPGSSVPKTSNGQWAGLWHEFDFGSSPNNGWSGTDCSALASHDNGIPITTGCNVCNAGICSTILKGGSGTNAYTGGTNAVDGLGLNLPAGNIALTVEVGYQA